MGRERAVEVLQQLVDRVVVAVAEVAVVELVGPRPEAPDAEVVVRVLDLLRPRGVTSLSGTGAAVITRPPDVSRISWPQRL